MIAARIALAAAALALLVTSCGDGEPSSGTGPDGATTSTPRPPAPEPPDLARANILVMSLDTCRSDALHFGGGPSGISDRLDAFAGDSIVFTRARSHAPHTAPSHMTLFTSMYPSVHGVQNVQHGVHPKTGERLPLIQKLPDVIPTMAEVLAANGYRTMALTDGGNLNRSHGFARGFEVYTQDLSGAAAQVDDALARLDALAASADPWFLFWHTYEIHAPYVSPKSYLDRWAPADYRGPLVDVIAQLEGLDFAGRFGAMKTTFWREKDSFGPAEARFLHGLYEAGVDYTDDELARLFAALESKGVFDDTIVVLLSDHGEEFAEHGQWQHDQLYEECLRVPLVVRMPGRFGAGRRVDVPVGLIDVMPTLLELVGARTSGLEIDGETRSTIMQGRSLAETILGGKDPKPLPVISEYRADRHFPDGAPGPLYDWQIAIEYEGRKFHYDEHRSNAAKGVERRLLFDLRNDPGETRDLSGQGGPALDGFMGIRKRFLADVERFSDIERKMASGELDAASMEQLAQLGYLGGDEDEEPETKKDGR